MAQRRQRFIESLVTDELVRAVGFFLGIVILLAEAVARFMGLESSWQMPLVGLALFFGPSITIALVKAYRTGESNGRQNGGGSSADS